MPSFGELRVGSDGRGSLGPTGGPVHLVGAGAREGIVGRDQAFGGRRQRPSGVAERVEDGPVGGHVGGGRAVVQGVEGVVLGVGGADEHPLSRQHMGAVPPQAAHADGVAPEPRGALAGLGGAGNADRLDIRGVGGGQPGPGLPDSGVRGKEAVEVDDAGVAARVRLAGVAVVAPYRERIDLAECRLVPCVRGVAGAVRGCEGAQGALGGVENGASGHGRLFAAAGALQSGKGAVDGAEGALFGAGGLRNGGRCGQQEGSPDRHGGKPRRPGHRWFRASGRVPLRITTAPARATTGFPPRARSRCSPR